MSPKNEIDKNKTDHFQARLKSLRNNNFDNCPPASHLTRYFTDELSGKELKSIEDHLNFCPLCISALESLKTAKKTDIEEKQILKNWGVIEKELDEKVYASLESISTTAPETATTPHWKKYFETLRESWIKFSNSFLAPKVLAYAGSVAILLVIGLYSITYFSRSDFYYLAEIKTEKQVSLRTETVSSSLTESLTFFDDGNYKKAVEKFESLLEKSPGNYSANYYLGLCYLNISKTGLPGLAYKYDRYEVKDGIKYLEAALTSAGENQFYQEDCYWYLGKAYLMIEDVDKAKLKFRKILNLEKMNLLRKEEARVMLSVLN